MVTRLNFTRKSAIASDTQNGAVPRIPKIGICSEAHVTSLEGSKKLITLEKAIKKKMIVSIEEPNIEDEGDETRTTKTNEEETSFPNLLSTP